MFYSTSSQMLSSFKLQQNYPTNTRKPAGQRPNKRKAILLFSLLYLPLHCPTTTIQTLLLLSLNSKTSINPPHESTSVTNL